MKALTLTAAAAFIAFTGAASAMFSLQSDDALATFLDRYDISVDPSSVTAEQRVELSFIDVSADMTSLAIKAQIMSVLGDADMAMGIIDSQVNNGLQNLLDNYDFAVDVNSLTTAQRVQLSFIDTSSMVSSSEIKAQIRTVLSN
jgi:hypothetical protein